MYLQHLRRTTMSPPSVNFGNWIRRRIVLAFLAVSLVLIGLSAVVLIPIIRAALWILVNLHNRERSDINWGA
jgi:uncharacterized protein involved in exopolysaccharide biosynthesis